jgi:hypothetical protein
VNAVAGTAHWRKEPFTQSQSLEVHRGGQNRQASLTPLKAVRLVRNHSSNWGELRKSQAGDRTYDIASCRVASLKAVPALANVMV